MHFAMKKAIFPTKLNGICKNAGQARQSVTILEKILGRQSDFSRFRIGGLVHGLYKNVGGLPFSYFVFIGLHRVTE